MAETFAERAIRFNRRLRYTGDLPEGFRVMNPFAGNPETLDVMTRFYRRFYSDPRPRRLILGINPGRHGAGVTGIPFTDTKRLESVCGIRMESAHTHEVSSVFVYDMIHAYGGAEAFYRRFYINSPFPLAILRQTADDRWLNANYYDDPALLEMTAPFMRATLRKLIHLGVDTAEVVVLGKKNAACIEALNRNARLFSRLTVLEHPRYIQQYHTRDRQVYIDKYLRVLGPPA